MLTKLFLIPYDLCMTEYFCNIFDAFLQVCVAVMPSNTAIVQIVIPPQGYMICMSNWILLLAHVT